MKCPNCGAKLNPKDEFCMACGELIEDMKFENENPSSNSDLNNNVVTPTENKPISTESSQPVIDNPVNPVLDAPKEPIEVPVESSAPVVESVPQNTEPTQNTENALSFSSPVIEEKQENPVVDTPPVAETNLLQPGQVPVVEPPKSDALVENVEIKPEPVIADTNSSSNSIGSIQNPSNPEQANQAPIFNGFSEENNKVESSPVVETPEEFYVAAPNNEPAPEPIPVVLEEKKEEATDNVPNLMNSPQDEVITTIDETQKPKKKSSLLVFIIITAILLLAVGGYVFYLYYIKGEEDETSSDNTSSSVVENTSSSEVSDEITLNGFEFTIPSEYTVTKDTSSIMLLKSTKTIIISYVNQSFQTYTSSGETIKSLLTGKGYTIAKEPLLSTISGVKFYITETTLQTQKRLIAYTPAPNNNTFMIELYDNTTSSYSYSELSNLSKIFTNVN